MNAMGLCHRRLFAEVSLALSVLLVLTPAAAESLHTCNESGKMVFSNTDLASKDSCKISIRNSPANKRSKAKAGTAKSSKKSGNYPSVSSSTQQRRDQTRLKILMDELSTERQLALGYQDKMQNDIGLTEQELKTIEKVLSNHILNIQALQKEIKSLR